MSVKTLLFRFGSNVNICRYFRVALSLRDKILPDHVDLITGREKKEYLALTSGDGDPYALKLLEGSEGTREKPNLVPSFFNSRIVGCICEEDSSYVVWMWLHRGEPKRCECGRWFQLVDRKEI